MSTSKPAHTTTPTTISVAPATPRTDTAQNSSTMRTLSSLLKENAAAARIRRLSHEAAEAEASLPKKGKQRQKRWSSFASTSAFAPAGDEGGKARFEVQEEVGGKAEYAGRRRRRRRRVSRGERRVVLVDRERRQRGLMRRFWDHKWTPDFLQ
ncbi:hypothetical protein EJ03DRAFT_354058 [Teratosphaeria nubilosa]|uniref:Uncharacterized protein n=1 Tax=Teratosphaeria nubilosa TaxID=161662 RepID=A0A6G1L178_9PEZI|nr:hypothetical protein EJ03DRAFT_354058 [Teratosphaeria nubilosa]